MINAIVVSVLTSTEDSLIAEVADKIRARLEIEQIRLVLYTDLAAALSAHHMNTARMTPRSVILIYFVNGAGIDRAKVARTLEAFGPNTQVILVSGHTDDLPVITMPENIVGRLHVVSVDQIDGLLRDIIIPWLEDHPPPSHRL